MEGIKKIAELDFLCLLMRCIAIENVISKWSAEAYKHFLFNKIRIKCLIERGINHSK